MRRISKEVRACKDFNKKAIARSKEVNTTHGKSYTKLYTVWQNMKRRINTKSNPSYKDYGGRGIEICKEWEENFLSFEAWALKNGYKEGLSLDRKENDGNYEPSNCRFTTQKIQNRNTQKIQRNNKTGYRGVMFDKERNKFLAQISLNGVPKHLGRFSTALEGAKAYDKYIIDNNLEHTINGVAL